MPGRDAASRPSARLIRRLAARRRPEHRRRLRHHVQVLAAVGTVLAGLMSVPALVISISALKMSEQQQREERARRERSERQVAREKAAAAAREKVAFVNRVIFRARPATDAVTYDVRNANSLYAELLITIREDVATRDGLETRRRNYSASIPPCAHAELVVERRPPPGGELVGGSSNAALYDPTTHLYWNYATRAFEPWDVTKHAQVDDEVEPKILHPDIHPCT